MPTRSRHATTPNWSSKSRRDDPGSRRRRSRTFLAGRAGFNLKKLLIDYLNDVQVVTEFDNYREELLDIFRRVVETTYEFFPEADLYIIAHSEGTVITFMGLSRAIEQRGVDQAVKGLMTIGSPLNKHVWLWPELFSEFVAPDKLPDGMQPIQWRNYYDYGDPVAYNLRSTRRWMAHHRWTPFFNFKDPQDKQSSTKTIPVHLAVKLVARRPTSSAVTSGSRVISSPVRPITTTGGSGCLRPLSPNRRRSDRADFATYVAKAVQSARDHQAGVGEQLHAPLPALGGSALPRRLCDVQGPWPVPRSRRHRTRIAGRDRPECPRALRHPGGDDPHRTHSAPDQEAKATPLGVLGLAASSTYIILVSPENQASIAMFLGAAYPLAGRSCRALIGCVGPANLVHSG